MSELCFITAVNSERILLDNLLSSDCFQGSKHTITTVCDALSASSAYNSGMEATVERYCVFVHQDVFLPVGWDELLVREIKRLDAIDDSWAVLGVYGISDVGSRVGRVWSSGLNRELHHPFESPVSVQSVDELLIVMDRTKGLRFDEQLPGFHLYGTDIVQKSRDAGFGAYVIHAPVIHNSRPVRTLFGQFYFAAAYLTKKYRNKLPIQTPVTTIDRFLLRTSLLACRILLRRFLRRSVFEPCVNPKELADRLGYNRPI